MKKFNWRISPANVNVDDLLQKSSSPLHPLQSEIWGKAKKEIHNINSLYVFLFWFLAVANSFLLRIIIVHVFNTLFYYWI